MAEKTVNVRYMVDDVDTAVEFYTTHPASPCVPARRRRSRMWFGGTCACF